MDVIIKGYLSDLAKPAHGCRGLGFFCSTHVPREPFREPAASFFLYISSRLFPNDRPNDRTKGVKLAVRHQSDYTPCTIRGDGGALHVHNLADSWMHRARSNDQDCGAVAAVMTRDSESDTSGVIVWVLSLYVPFVCACFAPARSTCFSERLCFSRIPHFVLFSAICRRAAS